MTRLRKAITRTVDVSHPAHGFKDRLIMTVHPGGTIDLREPRGHDTVSLDLGILFATELIGRAMHGRRIKS